MKHDNYDEVAFSTLTTLITANRLSEIVGVISLRISEGCHRNQILVTKHMKLIKIQKLMNSECWNLGILEFWNVGIYEI